MKLVVTLAFPEFLMVYGRSVDAPEFVVTFNPVLVRFGAVTVTFADAEPLP